MATTYKDAGVDIDAGDALVERIKPLARATHTPNVLSSVGGFASLFKVPDDVPDPVLVSGTDGVGTKLRVAIMTGKHDTIGQDLVAMCVNDVITCGARPLFFLDYFATARLDVDVAESVVRSIAEACKLSDCALVGGETAELPGMYADGDYDLAGFAVGIVSRPRIIDGSRVAPGDVLVGVASSGLHSNGYSLARRLVFDQANLGPDACPAVLGGVSVRDALLAPTRLYARATQALVSAGVDAHAMCHVTGGGLVGNLPRVLPDGVVARVTAAWKEPPIYALIREIGGVAEAELRRTFNLGLGFVVVVPSEQAGLAVRAIASAGEEAFIFGRIDGADGKAPEVVYDHPLGDTGR